MILVVYLSMRHFHHHLDNYNWNEITILSRKQRANFMLRLITQFFLSLAFPRSWWVCASSNVSRRSFCEWKIIISCMLTVDNNDCISLAHQKQQKTFHIFTKINFYCEKKESFCNFCTFRDEHKKNNNDENFYHKTIKRLLWKFSQCKNVICTKRN